MVLPWQSSQTITPPSSFHGSPSVASPYSDASENPSAKLEHSTQFAIEELRPYSQHDEGLAVDMSRRYVPLPRQQTRSKLRSRGTASNQELQCRHCPQSFDDRSRLTQHEKTHSTNRIRCCRKGCSKEFNRRADLNRHERSVSLTFEIHELFANKHSPMMVSVMLAGTAAKPSKEVTYGEGQLRAPV